MKISINMEDKYYEYIKYISTYLFINKNHMLE